MPIFYFISAFLDRFIFIELFKNQLEDLLQADFVYSLFPQLFAVSNNLINCVRQELNGVEQWFVNDVTILILHLLFLFLKRTGR